MAEETETKPVVMLDSVQTIVRKAEDDFVSGETTISKYVSLSMYEILNRVDAYINSKHISGDTDSMGREKPFFNIVLAARNIWFRATDLDRKNMHIRATKSSQDLLAFLASVHLDQWMRKSKFGQYLNKWGLTLATYGSAVTKFVEKDDELIIKVVPWSTIICDVIDFAANPVIEKLSLTPAQLREHEEYDQDEVERLINSVQESRKDLDGQTKDNKSDYIEVYEIHGKLPLWHLTKADGDQTKYQQQMHAVSYVRNREDNEKYDDFDLYKGREAKSPYQKDDLIERDEFTLGIGSVENLFESQWMVNHSQKQIKDLLDIISKIVFQTADGNFVGQNVLDAIENGDILIHEPNMPLTVVGTNQHDITNMTAFSQQWQALGNQINGISEAMLGQNPKSGTAWRQTAAILQESQSLFEIMTENKGLGLENMMREWIIPFIKKQMDTTDEISATLESYHIDKIDAMYIPNEAIRRYNTKATEAVLNGQDVPQFDPQAEQASVRGELQQLGNKRYFAPSDIKTKTWKEVLKDIEWEFEIDITQEQKDMQQVMDTLQTALKMFVQATPEQLADPNFKLVFNEILRASSVISPIQIASIPPTPPPAPVNKISESMSYKDAPDDIRRQMEKQAGMQPSQNPASAPDKQKVEKQPIKPVTKKP